MGEYDTLLNSAEERLHAAGNSVHSVSPEKSVLLSALHNTGHSLLNSIQVILMAEKKAAGGEVSEFGNINFENCGEHIQNFSKVAKKYGIGFGELAAFHEIIHFGKMHGKDFTFGKGDLGEEQFLLSVLDFERFTTLFEKASQFYTKVQMMSLESK